MTNDRDRTRRYLVTVGSYPADGLDAHLAVTAWYDRADAWAHSQAVCGLTVPQGELDTGATVTCTRCEALRPDYEQNLGGNPAELTAAEARAEVERLGAELYQAQDALAFVAECCAIADREGRQPTTADVREWLKGAQCARQAGLVLPDPTDGSS